MWIVGTKKKVMKNKLQASSNLLRKQIKSPVQATYVWILFLKAKSLQKSNVFQIAQAVDQLNIFHGSLVKVIRKQMIGVVSRL